MFNYYEMPLVTIGVPYYNAEKYILCTLESIKNQSYQNIELILINDCTPDNTQQLVDKWIQNNKTRFVSVKQLINKKNLGLAHSCKLLQDAASGIYFSKLDSDDTILPNKITEQVAYLNDHEEVAMVYSNTLIIDSAGKLFDRDYFDEQNFVTVVNKIGPSGDVFKKLLQEDFIPNPSVLIRTAILIQVGGYDETLFAEDWDLWLRIAKNYKIDYMQGNFCQYRVHAESIMRRSESLIKVYKSLVKAFIKHLGISEAFDSIIAKHLYTYIIGMYRYGVIDKELLRLNLKYNRNIKSLLYYMAGLFDLKLHQKKYY